jgi:restriction system protein
MSYARHNPAVDLLSGLALWYVFSGLISIKLKIGLWSSSSIVLAVYAAFVLIVHFVQKVKRRRALRRTCVHGTKSGQSGGCLTCALAERKQEIQERADELYHSELASLRRKWLSRSELYLQMNWRQFENAIAELFKQLGYDVKQTPFSNDHGKDLIVWKNGDKYLVECKRYNAKNKIGRRDLQILVAAMKEEGAKGGFYINTGCFARTAAVYAQENNIELYDRHKLPVLVNSAYPVRTEITNTQVMCLECGNVEQLPLADSAVSGFCKNGHEITNKITTRLVCNAAFPFCEKCGTDMRVAKGRFRKFWVCSKYPQCTRFGAFSVRITALLIPWRHQD